MDNIDNEIVWRSYFEKACGSMFTRDIDGTFFDKKYEAMYQGFMIANLENSKNMGRAIADGTNQMIRQRQKGIAKYGACIEDFKGTPLELAQHAFEESCDQTVYLAELVRRLRKEAEGV